MAACRCFASALALPLVLLLAAAPLSGAWDEAINADFDDLQLAELASDVGEDEALSLIQAAVFSLSQRQRAGAERSASVPTVDASPSEMSDALAADADDSHDHVMLLQTKGLRVRRFTSAKDEL